MRCRRNVGLKLVMLGVITIVPGGCGRSSRGPTAPAIPSSGDFSANSDFPTALNPSSVAIGDVNRDGRPDLAMVNLNANTVSVLLGEA